MPSTQQPRRRQGVAGILAAFSLAVMGCSPAAQTTLAPPTVAPPTAAPTDAPAATPALFHSGLLAAGTYVTEPFAPGSGEGVCTPEATGCTEDPADDSISITFTIQDEHEGARRSLIWGKDGETGLTFVRGGGLYSDCRVAPPPDIAVGPTVEEFADALADHPLLDATTPVGVELAGYSGKYMDIEFPADLSTCPNEQFWPFEPGLYAQGADHRWHLWILDVDGLRVVIQSMDYASTPEAQRAGLQVIVDSLQIEP